MKEIFVLYGLLLFVDTLFYKWGVWHIMQKRGAMQTKSRYFYQLTQCHFCMVFWLCLSLCGLYSLINGFENWMVVLPFVVTGLYTLKRE